MRIEKEIYETNVFYDDDNNPTCAISFEESDKYCEFYRTQRFGTIETCLFAKTNRKGYGECLNRRNENGTLIPGDFCPFHQKDCPSFIE